MKTSKRILLPGLALFIALSSGGALAMPTVLSHEGTLNTSTGTPYSGPVTASYSLFAASSGGTALWTEAQTVTVTQGAYSAILGSSTPLPLTALAATAALFLEVTINGEVLTPRSQATAVPYALTCENATGNITPNSVSAGGGISAQNLKVQRDVLTFHVANDSTSTPIHIKTSIGLRVGDDHVMYRLAVDGYNYALQQPIESSCAGLARGDLGLSGGWCGNVVTGASISQYRSSDGFLVLKLSASNFWYSGFSLSARFVNPLWGFPRAITATAVRQAADL